MLHLRFLSAIGRTCVAAVIVTAGLIGSAPGPSAHEGHDHGAPEAAAGPTAPRLATHSDAFELVAVLKPDRRLVIFLDRFDSNEPVTNAAIAVTIGDAGEAVNAETTPEGTYTVTSPLFRAAGDIPLVFAITGDAGEDLLTGNLLVPPPEGAAAAPGASRLVLVREGLAAALTSTWRKGALGAATFILLLLCGYLFSRRRFVPATATSLLVIASLAILIDSARGHEGHDHDHAAPPAAAVGGIPAFDSPRRQANGDAFVPKPTQRLLEVRTDILKPQSARRAVSLIGRVIADPNRTSLVQSINGGRVMAPEAGLPRIGQAVKQGDLLAQIEPTVPQADRTTILEKLGEIEQMIAVAEAKIARLRVLVEKQVTAKSQLTDAEAELEGLRRRREVLRQTRVQPEQLRAPTSGVIAEARVVPGQVVQAQDLLFQIVDPSSLWVEALAFGDLDPALLRDATATAAGGASVTLRFQGFSQALRQQATVVQFVIENPPPNLRIGLPVTVLAHRGEAVSAMIVPKDAVVRSTAGETVVWVHEDPEIFGPRPVRIEPFDASRVIVAAGVAEGERVVIRAAGLINQVR